MDRGAWQATVHGNHKERGMTEMPGHARFFCTASWMDGVALVV